MTTTIIATMTPATAPARPRTTSARRPWHALVRRIARRRPPAVGLVERTAPTGTPSDLTKHVGAVEDHERGTAVWAYIGNTWQQATVISSAGTLVGYQAPGSGDWLVGQVPAFHLVRSADGFGGSSPAIGRDEAVAGRARATLLVHHANAHGMCQGCGDLAHFCWAPCPDACGAMHVLEGLPADRVGAR